MSATNINRTYSIKDRPQTLVTAKNLDESIVKHYLPLIVASIALIVVVIILYVGILTLNDNHFVYVLDDAYIHLAMSQNVVEHGNYGPTPYAFEPASSSYLWNLILVAIFIVTGTSLYLPLILNVIFGVLILFVMHKIWLTWLPDQPNSVYIAILLVNMLCIPIPAMIFTGMEHVLQILVTILVAYFAVEVLTAQDNDPSMVAKLGLTLLLMGLFSIRFEAVFLASMVLGLLILKRQKKFAFALGAVAALPLVISSLYLIANDRSALPNSVLSKSRGSLPILFRFIENSLQVPSIALPLFFILSISYLWRNYRQSKRLLVWEKPYVTLLIASGVVLQHLAVANFGQFFRYEAYLMALMGLAGTFIVTDLWRTYQQSSLDSVKEEVKTSVQFFNGRKSRFVGSLIIIALLSRAGLSFLLTPYAARDVYSSAYQAGHFLDEYYSGKTVILNDIGYPSYYADIHLLDLLGLGSHDWLDTMRAENVNQQTMGEWANRADADIAVVYSFFTPTADLPETRVPDTWILVGQWQIKHQIFVIADDVWNFYAIDEADAAELHEHLVEFAERLPSNVEFVDVYGD